MLLLFSQPVKLNELSSKMSKQGSGQGPGSHLCTRGPGGW